MTVSSAPAILPLGLCVNASATGAQKEAEKSLYTLFSFPVAHHVPKGTLLYYSFWNSPREFENKKGEKIPVGGGVTFGEEAEGLGIKPSDTQGNAWPARGATSGAAATVFGSLLTAHDLNPGDLVYVEVFFPSGAKPLVGEAGFQMQQPTLSLTVWGFGINGFGSPPTGRLIVGAEVLAPASGYDAHGLWVPVYKGGAAHPTSSDELVVEYAYESNPGGEGEDEEFTFGGWHVKYEPTGGVPGTEPFKASTESHAEVADVPLDLFFAPEDGAASRTFTVTPGDMTLGEGVLKRGGWRLDVYYSLQTHVADAGSTASLCFSDGSETYVFPSWGIAPPPGNILTALTSATDMPDELIATLQAEGVIPTQPERLDVDYTFQQTAITDARGRVCGSAAFNSGHAVSYWATEGAGAAPTEAEWFVGGVSMGSGAVSFSEGQAIAGVEIRKEGIAVPPITGGGAEEEGEEVVGPRPAVSAGYFIAPTSASHFNTLDYETTVHLIVYFPPDTEKEEEEKRLEEYEEEVKAEEKREEERLKEEEEEVAHGKEEGKEHGEEPGGEKPSEETHEEEREREKEEGEGGGGSEGEGGTGTAASGAVAVGTLRTVRPPR